MRQNYFFALFTFLVLLVPASMLAQCKVNNKVMPDGSMSYFVGALPLYTTNEKKLTGGVITDDENYYIAFYPVPYPAKPAGNNLKGDALVKLSNQKTYALKRYDSWYPGDSTFMMIFLVDKKWSEDFQKNDVEETTFNMGKEEPARVYAIKRHKNVIREQLACLKDRKN